MVTEGERITDSSQCGSDGVAVATVLVLAGKSGRIYRMTRRLFPLGGPRGSGQRYPASQHTRHRLMQLRERVCVCVVCVWVCVCGGVCGVCVCVVWCVCVVCVCVCA